MKEQNYMEENLKTKVGGGAFPRTGEAGLEGRVHWCPALQMDTAALRSTGDKETLTLPRGLAQAPVRLGAMAVPGAANVRHVEGKLFPSSILSLSSRPPAVQVD